MYIVKFSLFFFLLTCIPLLMKETSMQVLIDLMSLLGFGIKVILVLHFLISQKSLYNIGVVISLKVKRNFLLKPLSLGFSEIKIYNKVLILIVTRLLKLSILLSVCISCIFKISISIFWIIGYTCLEYFFVIFFISVKYVVMFSLFNFWY